MTRTRKSLMASMIVAAGAGLGLLGPVEQAGADHDRPIVIETNAYFAGELRINDKHVRINSGGNVHQQINNWFNRCGFESYCQGGVIRVRIDPYCPPKVKWKSGDWRVNISRHHDWLILTPTCRTPAYGAGYGNQGYGNQGYRPPVYGPTTGYPKPLPYRPSRVTCPPQRPVHQYRPHQGYGAASYGPHASVHVHGQICLSNGCFGWDLH